MEDQRGWAILKQETENGLSLLRIKRFETTFDFDAYPERLNVVWDYQEPTHLSTPSAHDIDAMEQFENRICRNIEADDKCILSMVFTEPGYREYVFYAKRAESFIDALNAIPQEREPYPIEITHEPDRGFDFYHSYASGIGSKP